MKESPNDPAATSTSPALTARAPSASPHQTKPDLQNAMPGVDARAMCDYDRVFHPFFVKQNMVVAPPHSFLRDDAAKLAVSQMIDEALSLPREGTEDSMDIDDEPEAAGTRGVTKEEIVELLHIPPHKARIHCGHVLPFSTKDILARIENPDDPGLPPLVIGSKKGPYNSTYYTKLLNKLPNKFLKFAEDIRPPYNGTYTRQPTSSGLRTGRNPLEETLPGVDYDYDSEAEWVAEDGEELLSEGEDDDDKESEASGSLDGFLDDEEDTGPKRGGTAILLPTNSGMCWEDATGKTVRPDLEDMRISFLLGMLVTGSGCLGGMLTFHRRRYCAY